MTILFDQDILILSNKVYVHSKNMYFIMWSIIHTEIGSGLWQGNKLKQVNTCEPFTGLNSEKNSKLCITVFHLWYRIMLWWWAKYKYLKRYYPDIWRRKEIP